MRFICCFFSFLFSKFCFNKLRVRRIVLEDEHGTAKAELEVDARGNTTLHFRDDKNQNRLYIGITPEGTPRIGLSYAEGKGSIQLEANDKLNSSAILFCGPDGKPQILLGIANTGLPAFGLYDGDGKLLFPNFLNKNEELLLEPNTKGLYSQ
ncbi:MAG: hypothetical protein ACP5KS_06270, partial [Candidatus Hydrogenedens sp.]